MLHVPRTKTLLPATLAAVGLTLGLGFTAQPADAATLPVVTSGDLIVHLDANLGVTTDTNGNVSTWADQDTSNTSNSISANDFTQSSTGARPTLISNSTPTGSAALSFDGDDDRLQGAEFFDFSEFTIFAVARGKRGDGFLGSIFWDYGNTTTKQNFLALDDSRNPSSSSGFEAQVRSAETVGSGNAEVNPASRTSNEAAQWNVITSRLSGQTLELYVNSVLADSATNTLYVTTTTWEGAATGGKNAPTIGNFPNADNVAELDGDIAALLIYRGALSDTDRAAVEDSLFNAFVIPEPATVALVGLGGVILLGRRRWA